jgi:hypothetical protein
LPIQRHLKDPEEEVTYLIASLPAGETAPEASVQIEEAKLSHANLPRSEHENLKSDLYGGRSAYFSRCPRAVDEQPSIVIVAEMQRSPRIDSRKQTLLVAVTSL